MSCIISPKHLVPSPQTINCLELWAKLLAAKADEPELRPLIYPVCQVRAQAATGRRGITGNAPLGLFFVCATSAKPICTSHDPAHPTPLDSTALHPAPSPPAPVQLLLGVARLVPAPAHFPLRLRCARALNRLGEATRTFIPVAPVLLEVLQVIAAGSMQCWE